MSNPERAKDSGAARRAESPASGNQVRDLGSLVVTFSRGVVKIRLRESASKDGHSALAARLEEVLKETPAGHGWTVDLSELSQLPLGLANVLLGFQDSLRSQGRPFRLVGASGKLFPPPQARSPG